MIYTIDKTKGESFDAELLRQELVAVIGSSDGWYINTVGDSVDFQHTDVSIDKLPAIDAAILAHFANGAKREANRAILKQIDALEATVTERRYREAVLGIDNGWLKALNDQITALRGGLQK